MWDLKLFVAFRADAPFERALRGAHAPLATLLTGGGDYLSTLSLAGERYYGKPIPIATPVAHLEAFEAHVLSLLQRLAPDYPFSENPPLLLTQIDDPACH